MTSLSTPASSQHTPWGAAGGTSNTVSLPPALKSRISLLAPSMVLAQPSQAFGSEPAERSSLYIFLCVSALSDRPSLVIEGHHAHVPGEGQMAGWRDKRQLHCFLGETLEWSKPPAPRVPVSCSQEWGFPCLHEADVVSVLVASSMSCRHRWSCPCQCRPAGKAESGPVTGGYRAPFGGVEA